MFWRPPVHIYLVISGYIVKRKERDRNNPHKKFIDSADSISSPGEFASFPEISRSFPSETLSTF